MESVRLKINEHTTSVGEDILCVLDILCVRRVKLDIRVFVLERLSMVAEVICSLFQSEMETLHNIKLHTAEHHRERSTVSREMTSKTSTWSEEPRETDQGRGLLHAKMQPVVKLYKIDQSAESSLKVKRVWSVKQESENHLDINEETSVQKEDGQPSDRGSPDGNLTPTTMVSGILETSSASRDSGVLAKGKAMDRELNLRHLFEEDSDMEEFLGFPATDSLHLPVCKEEVSPEHEQMSPSLVQEEPQAPHIKEEQEELLQRPEEVMTLLAVKSEDDDENRETEAEASTSTQHMKTQADVEDCGTSQPSSGEHMKTQANVEDCGTSQPTRNEQLLSPHCSESDVIEYSDDWEETSEGQSAVNAMDSHKTQHVEKQTLSSSHKLSQDLTLSTQGRRLMARLKRQEKFSCKVCGKCFRDSDHLKTHMRTHTGEKPFSCNVCAKGFSQMCTLKSHMRTHTGEKRLSCKVCGKGFSDSGHLKRHMRTHTGEKPYICNVCAKGFSLMCTLKSHMRTHTGEPFSCNVCGNGFSESGHLKRHMITHTGKRPFSCNVCRKGFSDSGHLKRHMRTHTGGKY